MDVRTLKQTLNHGLVLKKHAYNNKIQPERMVDMNTKLRTEANNYFEKDLFKLMNISAFGKTMENVRKHGDIRLVTTDKRRSYLVIEPNYYATKWFSENVLATEMNKTKLKMNKPIYLGLSM